MNRVGDNDQAEDLAHEVIAKLYLALARNPKIDNFPAWVWSITRYTYYGWLRMMNPNLSLDMVVGVDSVLRTLFDYRRKKEKQ